MAVTEQDIISKYPILYQNYAMPPSSSPMCFGFECGKGWLGIIDELSSKIEAWNKVNLDSPVIAQQVKEKFGGLRFYANCSVKEVDQWIIEAEDKAWNTCSRCGSTHNIIHTEGWIETICKKCLNKKELSNG